MHCRSHVVTVPRSFFVAVVARAMRPSVVVALRVSEYAVFNKSNQIKSNLLNNKKLEEPLTGC